MIKVIITKVTDSSDQIIALQKKVTLLGICIFKKTTPNLTLGKKDEFYFMGSI